MVSENKKSNQAAGEDYRYCRRSHWLAVLGTMLMLEIPDDLRGHPLVDDWWVDLRLSAQNVSDWLRISKPCTCSNCQRRPRRSDDKNPHEGTVML